VAVEVPDLLVVPEVAAALVVAAATFEAEDEEDAVLPPMGAVDWPAIWLWTVALKVPVMLSRVNLAENASAGKFV